ncbi:GNAT family N-acetyltransferase [Hyunsoonleella sp. SJ7]|uniref:GNAT family N-acetyltransferase n=1 Tax=Hyunsoonleella aquatilis TaxID=2762758 RepID=A0A923KIP6_9FLAO|nr:GNAT family N-acetyltransferase [Hyunsoonleella aquatilis]MBC3758934.1 GNAT family N-acetyltransferase [Hyunsoonleella aquatilis]
MKVSTRDKINQEAYRKVVELLVEYNLNKKKHLENSVNKPIEIIARNNAGEIIGGLYGRSIWGTLEIKTFAVKSEYRNEGIGEKLIKEAEIEAKKRNCRFISLDTFSFQAPKFYEKYGFKKVGTETDFPLGFEKYYYQKKID